MIQVVNQQIIYQAGDNGHLVPIEETGFDFGKFIWLKQGNPNFPDGEPIEIYKDISDDIPNTLQSYRFTNFHQLIILMGLMIR